PPRSAPRLFSLVEIAPGWAFFQGTSHYLDRADQRSAGHGGDGREDRGPQEQRDPLRQARGTGLPHWFVAGYGTARSLPLPRSVEGITAPASERLASLFDRGRIVGTGFADLLNTK